MLAERYGKGCTSGGAVSSLRVAAFGPGATDAGQSILRARKRSNYEGGVLRLLLAVRIRAHRRGWPRVDTHSMIRARRRGREERCPTARVPAKPPITPGRTEPARAAIRAETGVSAMSIAACQTSPRHQGRAAAGGP